MNKKSGIAFGSLNHSLLAYRIMAFITGTVLLFGSLGLVFQIDHSVIGPLWLAHGYLFLVYVVTAVNLSLHMRWPLPRMLAIAAAGTIPAMSFIAERNVVKHVKQP